MSRQVSPFAALSGAEKQIKWLEYQSIRLPYVSVDAEATPKPATESAEMKQQEEIKPAAVSAQPTMYERPQPPPEVPRVMPDMQKTRHSQYDAVIARMKQAELQSRRFQHLSQITQQTK